MFDDSTAIDMSTVDPNVTIDQTADGGDGGASSFSDLANSVGRWGAVIGSIVTNKPIAVNAQGVPVGAVGTKTPMSQSNKTILIVAGIAAVVVVVVLMAGR